MTSDSVTLYSLIARAAECEELVPQGVHPYPITVILPGRAHDSVYLTFCLFA